MAEVRFSRAIAGLGLAEREIHCDVREELGLTDVNVVTKRLSKEMTERS
jgi:hypothetical protein